MMVKFVPFLDVFKDASGGNIKTPQSEFLEEGNIPVVDQGQSLVAGYVMDRSRICRATPPVIVFGDHTRAIKYVDFDFAMGADGTKVLVPRSGDYPKYLYHALKATRIPSAGYSRHYKFLKETSIPLPPLPVQKRIAKILDAADALRAKRRESIAQLDALIQSTFLDMFGDPFDGTSDDKHVPFIKLTERITYGFTCPMSHLESGIPIITAKNVLNGTLDMDNVHFADFREFDALTEKSKPSPGDVLITKDGSIGRCAVVPKGGPICINQSVALVIPRRSTVIPEYISAYIRSAPVQQRIQRMGKGNALKHLQITELAKFPSVIPPLPLQHHFASIVESIERQKARLRAHLAELDTLFASLQHRAFNGEL
jgi:type I restriction enzyme, S subunit